MKITYDPDKNEKNIYERQLSFDEVVDFDWETAYIEPDLRKNYGENRYISAGFLHERLHILVFTPTVDGIRVISFRKANKREIKRYEEQLS
ncbi:BrnT family toxin [Moraxella boevrei]|uniref:BrnT family toxin n=1 Tax=Faucicola boevrei TaxID=346665 RepID=UPI003735A2C9